MPPPPPPPPPSPPRVASLSAKRARRVDVRRLPLGTSEGGLRKFMADLGITAACTVDCPRHRPHATMTFSSAAEAQSVAASLNGMVFRGRLLAVSTGACAIMGDTVAPPASAASAASAAAANKGGVAAAAAAVAAAAAATAANNNNNNNNSASSVPPKHVAFGKHVTADTQEVLWRSDPKGHFPSCGNPEARQSQTATEAPKRRKGPPLPSFSRPRAEFVSLPGKEPTKPSCPSCGGPVEPHSDRGAVALACGRHFHCGLCANELRSHNVRQPSRCCLPCVAASGGQATVSGLPPAPTSPIEGEDGGGVRYLDRKRQAADELHDQAAMLVTSVVRYVTRTGCGWVNCGNASGMLPSHLKRRLDESVVKLLAAEKQRMTSRAEYLLARILLQPGSPARDHHRGMHYCVLASSAGHPGAMCMLGRIFATTDMVKACRWYSSAARAGHREAQYLLGLALLGDCVGGFQPRGEFLRDGVSLPRDTDRAVALLSLAVEPTDDGSVHAGAANVLGLLCLRGVSTEGKGYGAEWRHRGKEADRAAAVRWFEVSAEGGCADGQYNFGRFSCSDGRHSGGGGGGRAMRCRRALGHGPTTDKGKGGGGAGGGGSGGAGAGAGAGSEANGGGGDDDDDDDDDPSGGWYRKPHGDRGWSPPSKKYPEPPVPPAERDPWANWKDVEIRTWGGAAKANGFTFFEGGGVEGIGCSVNSLKWFARAAAQGHAAARLELDRWLPPVATSLEGLASGSRVFLGDFVAEGFEFLNGEAAVIDEIAENGTSCSVRLLPDCESQSPSGNSPTDARRSKRFYVAPGNLRPLLC